MTFQDLTKIPLSGTALSLADVYRLAHYKTVCKLGYADIDRELSDEERHVVNQLACWIAEIRGYKTVDYGCPFAEIMDSDRIVCPFTLRSCQGIRSLLRSSYLLKHCNGGAEGLDFFAIKMGWLPTDFWAAEREKETLSNMINPEADLWGKMLQDQGAIVPSLPQLCTLIVEMEGRLNEAITAASAIPYGTFTVDTTFGSSTACKSFPAGEASNGVKAHAHEFQWISFPDASRGWAHARITTCNESKDHSDCYVFSYRSQGEPHNLEYPVEFDKPLPYFASFLSPAIAVAKLVSLSYQRNINWTPEFKETYLAAAIYFLKLLGSVTSGKKFAETVATRPTTSGLPQLEGHVEVGVKFHANHERHNRVFPSLANSSNGNDAAAREEIARAPSRRRVASETRDDEWQEPAGYDARRPNEAERRRHEEMLKAALKRYEGSVKGLNQKLDAAFDDGKKVDLFTLLCDWPAVLDAVGDEEAKELREAQEAKTSAYKILDEWVYEVCEPHT